MKVCFRIDIKYVEKDTGLGLWFRIPGTQGKRLVWIPCCNADKHACGERFEYIIQVDDDFPLTVKTQDGDKKMLPHELLATYQIPHAEEEQEYIEEHKDGVKDWNNRTQSFTIMNDAIIIKNKFGEYYGVEVGEDNDTITECAYIPMCVNSMLHGTRQKHTANDLIGKSLKDITTPPDADREV